MNDVEQAGKGLNTLLLRQQMIWPTRSHRRVEHLGQSCPSLDNKQN